MRKPKRFRTKLADLLVLAILTGLTVLAPVARHQQVPDKVEFQYYRLPDSIQVRQDLQQVEAERNEMGYYLRVHTVTDIGYYQVAQYNNSLEQEHRFLERQLKLAQTGRTGSPKTVVRRMAARERLLPAVQVAGGYWKAGHFLVDMPLNGPVLMRDYQGRVVSAVCRADTIVSAVRIDEVGVYRGQMGRDMLPSGYGVMDEYDGCHKEGFWQGDQLHGTAFDSSPLHQLRMGEWKEGRFLGERLKYTNDRIYGIDISRHQHEKGRQRFGIDWKKLRITSLGKRHPIEGRTFPVSFVYIKATEGTTVRNRYFVNDYMQAKRHGYRVGAYHFFSLKSTAEQQAAYFLNHSLVHAGDFPPVLDVEPSEAQIQKIGDEELMRRIRVWMRLVQRRTHQRPILYVSQMFINKHMKNADDIKQHYNVWIARYGEYKPDVKLVYWQLCPDGRVDGITGPVDINVFNGYQSQYDDFKRTGFHQ